MTVGKFQIDEKTAAEIYEAGQYVITYGRVYQVFAPNSAYPEHRCLEIYNNRYGGKPSFCRRGTWKRMTAQQVNSLVGFKLLNT